MATHASRNDPPAHPRRTDKRLANHGPAVTRTRTARLMRPGRGGAIQHPARSCSPRERSSEGERRAAKAGQSYPSGFGLANRLCETRARCQTPMCFSGTERACERAVARWHGCRRNPGRMGAGGSPRERACGSRLERCPRLYRFVNVRGPGVIGARSGGARQKWTVRQSGDLWRLPERRA